MAGKGNLTGKPTDRPSERLLTLQEIKSVLRARVTEADSLRAAAATMRISPQHLSKVLTSVTAEPGPRILSHLGYRAVSRFERIPTTGGK